jgi:hypothetical protein
MKKALCVFLLICAGVLCSFAASAAEPVELYASRSGNSFTMTDYKLEDGKITVVIRMDFSPEELQKTIALLKKQYRADAPGADPNGLKYNEFCLRYSEDGSKYQRRYDRYCNEKGEIIRSLGLDPEYWQDTPSSEAILPAKALLAAAKSLGITMSLPAPRGSFETADSLQSGYARTPLDVDSLAAVYRSNRTVFEADYENAVIQVRGIAGALGKQFGLPSMRLFSEKGSGTAILCCFDDTAPEVRQLCAPGSLVVIEGVWRKGAAQNAVFIMDRCTALRRISQPAKKTGDGKK